MTVRAVLYLRQSTFREESISLEVQEEACRAHARKHGYKVVGVHADPGISGRTWQRKGVQAVMDAIESKQADVIILWRWSRLSRSRRDWALAADRADLAGARIESATEPNDATAAGRFARGVMTELAAFESERIGEAWKEAHGRRTAAGLPANGKARFGYAYDREAKLHRPDETTGPVLADLYRRYVGGASIYALTRWLNDAGHPPAAGYGVGAMAGVWSERTLRRMLDSGFGAGLINVHGEQHPGAHEAVISETLWAQYLEARGARARPSGKGRHEYTLSGLCWCGICGSRMAAETDGDGRARLRCRASKSIGAHPGGYASHEIVQADVRSWLDGRADGEGAVGDLLEPARERVRDFDAEVARLSEQLLTATRKHIAGVIPEDAYLVVRGEIEEQIMGVKAAATAARAAASLAPVRARARTLHDDWEKFTIPERREMLRLLVDRITVTPGRPRATVTITSRSL